MILIEATINGTLYRVSNDAHALTHFWQPYVSSFNAPNFDSVTLHGGFCKIVFGSIGFVPKMFKEEWPPPDKINLIISYTDTTEEEKVVAFTVIAYLKEIKNTEIVYDMREPEYNQKAIQECVDYDGNKDIPVPYIIGTVQHAEPVRVADVASDAAYRIGGIELTNAEKVITHFSFVDSTYTKVTTASAHGFNNGDSVVISDSKDYNGTYTVSSVTSTTFYIIASFDPGVPLWDLKSASTPFSPAPDFGSVLNSSFEDWTGSNCDNWTLTPTGTTAISKETNIVRNGSNAIKITFDNTGYGFRIESANVSTGFAPSRTYATPTVPIRITIYVGWVGDNPIDLMLYSGDWGGSFHQQVITINPINQWQTIEFETTLIQWSASVRLGFQVQRNSAYADEVLYLDGPVVIEATSPYTKVELNQQVDVADHGPDWAICGTVNYDGDYRMQCSDGNEFVIAKGYTAEDAGSGKQAYATKLATRVNEIPAHAVKSTTTKPFRIYDQGIPITDNATTGVIAGYNSFKLSLAPAGKVTISGSGSLTTLSAVIDAAATAMSLSYNGASARVVSPPVSITITQQQTILDYISSLCAFYSHMAYILSSTLYLVDCKRINQANPSGITIKENEYFQATYFGRVKQLKSIVSEWNVQLMRVLQWGDELFELYLDDRIVELDLTSEATGTTTSTTANKLVDSGATFVTDGITTDMFAKHYESGEIATITNVDSEIQLTVGSDIFESGDDYIVGERFPSGITHQITPYHQNVANVKTALLDIQSILMSDKIEVRFPLTSDNWARPGDQLNFTDNAKYDMITTVMKIRSLKYDFNNNTIIAIGEGSIS